MRAVGSLKQYDLRQCFADIDPTQTSLELYAMNEPLMSGGAQTLQRGLTLLRLLAQHQKEGLRMSDVVSATGLERSTVHRLLNCLVDEQFVERDEKTKRYWLGVGAMHLGAAAAKKMPIVPQFRPVVQRLARTTGDTVFLSSRDGDEGMCLCWDSGARAVNDFPTDAGNRKVLGVGASGPALLALLSDEDISAHISRCRTRYLEAGMTEETVWQVVRKVRKTGFGIVVHEPSNRAAIGCSVELSSRKHLGLSIGTLASLFTPARQRDLEKLLLLAKQEMLAQVDH